MKNTATEHLAKMPEIERRLFVDKYQYALDNAVKDAFKAVLADISDVTPFGIEAIDLLREIVPDAIDCGAIVDELANG